jgi:signal transduction histidine kinase
VREGSQPHERTEDRSPIDLHRLVRDVAEILEHTVDRSISVTTRCEASASVVVDDASQLQTSLLNLALNARDAMPQGGR